MENVFIRCIIAINDSLAYSFYSLSGWKNIFINIERREYMGLIDFIFGFGFILFALLVLYYSFVKRKGMC